MRFFIIYRKKLSLSLQVLIISIFTTLQFKHHTVIMEGRARRIHERNTKCKVLQSWYHYAQDERERGIAHNKLAADHYRW